MQCFVEKFDPREYAALTDLSGHRNRTLLCHQQTQKLIVRKEVHDCNRKLYQQLLMLRHENLVRMLGLEEIESHCYTYEEYINGQTLAEILAAGPVTEETAVDWIKQLCQAVKLLHAQKPSIIHRDIKPSNVMLAAGTIKLIDFNASKEFTPEQQRDTELVGTPKYAAPEQYGFAASNPRTDIYAIGILLHELLTGYNPTEISAPYKGRYAKVIQKCIEIDPKRRYRNIQELERQLETHSLRSLLGFSGRRQKAVALLAGSLLAIAALGTMLYRQPAAPETTPPQTQATQQQPKAPPQAAAKDAAKAPESEAAKPASTAAIQPQEAALPAPAENRESQELPPPSPAEANPPLGKLVDPYRDPRRIPWEQIDVTTYFAGLKIAGSDSCDAAFAHWKTWRTGENGSVYFPRGTTLEVLIENKSRMDLIQPVLRVSFIFGQMDDGVSLPIAGFIREADNTFYFRRDKIAAGAKVRYRLPLERVRIHARTMNQPVIGVDLRADNYPTGKGPILRCKFPGREP